VAPLPPGAQFADHLLDGGLGAFLAERREAGDSWDTIARKLWATTDTQIDVSGPTVKGWFERLEVAA
jgi:hypothetical protein